MWNLCAKEINDSDSVKLAKTFELYQKIILAKVSAWGGSQKWLRERREESQENEEEHQPLSPNPSSSGLNSVISAIFYLYLSQSCLYLY